MFPLHISRVPPIFFLLPGLWCMSVLLLRSNRVRIWWQESTLISTLAVFISVHSLGDFEVCLFCFLLIFFQGTLLLPVRETIQLCWAKGSSGAPWECWKLFALLDVCLRKFRLHSWTLAVQKDLHLSGAKYLPTLPSRAPVHKLFPYKAETGTRILIHRKLCQESNKSPGSAPNPWNGVEYLITAPLVTIFSFCSSKLLPYPYTLQSPLWTGKSQASERRWWWKKKILTG